MRAKDLKVGEQYKVRGYIHPVVLEEILPVGRAFVSYTQTIPELDEDLAVIGEGTPEEIVDKVMLREIERTWFSHLAKEKRERAKWAEQRATQEHVKDLLTKLGIKAQVGVMKDYIHVKLLFGPDGIQDPSIQKLAVVLEDEVVRQTLKEAQSGNDQG